MKIKGILTILAVVLLFSAAPVFAAEDGAAPQAQPEAVFPEMRYDFPLTPEGVEVTHEFPIKNTGLAVLDIQKVKTG